MSCDSLELLFQILFVFLHHWIFIPVLNLQLTAKPWRMPLLPWTKLLLKSMSLIVSFTFVVVCVRVTYALSSQILWLHLEVSLTDSSEPDCFLTHEFHYTGQMMLNIVRSCIGTKFTSRFGTLIAVRWLFLYDFLPPSFLHHDQLVRE